MSSQDLFAPSSETRRLSVQLTIEDLMKIGMSEEESQGLLKIRERYLKKSLVDWSKVQVPDDDFFRLYTNLKEVSKERGRELLSKLIVVCLNGGLGTRMGMKGPKCGLQILTQAGLYGPINFLDCKVMQIEELNNEYDVDVPLVLMNSFQTDTPTKKMIEKYKGKRVTIHTFTQSRYPLLYKDTLSPLSDCQSNPDSWYPPGSGEVFNCLHRSGLLEKFLKEGKDYMFLSNVENLGATVDLKLLDHIASASKLEFMIEVTNRISTDESGGTTVQYNDRVHVMEISQVPYEFLGKFGVSTFKYWNTNNIWAKLKVVNNLLRLGSLEFDFIVKNRTIKGRGILQLETPTGMAIHSFKNAASILVPRSRHKQVKKISQLLQIQSELYEIEKGMLVMNPKRVPPSEPAIKLGEEFQTLEQYEKRFKSLPNILELDHLTVSGNVTFGSNVTLKGTVIIVAETGSRIDIPDNVVLENKILSGSLVVLDY
jgi:UTP--glucose-1-phosphate uridylyltransferase